MTSYTACSGPLSSSSCADWSSYISNPSVAVWPFAVARNSRPSTRIISIRTTSGIRNLRCSSPTSCFRARFLRRIRVDFTIQTRTWPTELRRDIRSSDAEAEMAGSGSRERCPRRCHRWKRPDPKKDRLRNCWSNRPSAARVPVWTGFVMSGSSAARRNRWSRLMQSENNNNVSRRVDLKCWRMLARNAVITLDMLAACYVHLRIACCDARTCCGVLWVEFGM